MSTLKMGYSKIDGIGFTADCKGGYVNLSIRSITNDTVHVETIYTRMTIENAKKNGVLKQLHKQIHNRGYANTRAARTVLREFIIKHQFELSN